MSMFTKSSSSSSSSSTPGTVLEHLGLSSRGGGLGVILGSHSDEVRACEPHIALGVMDFATHKILNGQKYQNIVILSLDRDPNWVLRGCDIKEKNIDVLVFDDSYSSLDELLEDVMQCVNDAMKLGNTALIIHSLNELFISIGEFATFRWLESISKVTAPAINTMGDSSITSQTSILKIDEASERKFVALALCHGATVSSRTIARLQSTAAFVCTVTKASSALQTSIASSSGVVAEAYTVRRPPKHLTSSSTSKGNDKTSTTVGRSSEGVDLFALGTSTWGETVYEPCAALRSGKGKEDSKKQSGSSSIRQVPSSSATSTPAAPVSGSRMLSELAFETGNEEESRRNNTEGADTTSGATAVPQHLVKPKVKAPIITFDNHDPEFDEDSDPDGDLAF